MGLQAVPLPYGGHGGVRHAKLRREASAQPVCQRCGRLRLEREARDLGNRLAQRVQQQKPFQRPAISGG